MVFTLPSVLMVIEYIGSLTGMRRDSIPFRSGFRAGTVRGVGCRTDWRANESAFTNPPGTRECNKRAWVAKPGQRRSVEGAVP